MTSKEMFCSLEFALLFADIFTLKQGNPKFSEMVGGESGNHVIQANSFQNIRFL